MHESGVNWNYGGLDILSIEDVPEGAIGFIYIIRNVSKGMFYIGRKSFFSERNQEVSKAVYDRLKKAGEPVTKTKNKKKSKKGSIVWRYKKKTRKETNWKKYTGSSKELNKHIKSGDKYNKEILCFCYSKKEISYRELKHIVCTDCLEREDCYNGNLLGKWFPKDLKNERSKKG